MTMKHRVVRWMLGAVAGAIVLPAAAAATSYFRISPGALQAALNAYGQQAGEELIYRVDDVRGVETQGVTGRYDHEVALDMLLAGTGFDANRDQTGAMVIVRANSGEGARVDKPVRLARTATAVEAPSQPEATERDPLEEVVITGNIVGDLGLQDSAGSGSRLGLSLLETPAAIEVIDSSVMQARGYQKLMDAVGHLAGVTAGDRASATSEGAFAMRGFERNQILTLRDGIWLGPTAMVMRQQNTFNLERVEVLRGPASVLNGNGAVAGHINTINKTATASDKTSVNGLVNYGRFDSYYLGAGAGGPLGGDFYYRADVSHFESDSYVPRSDSHSTNFTGSVLWQAAERISLKLSLDYLDDETPDYWGTPLVPVSVALEPLTDVIRTTTGHTLDGAMRFNNYNVEDAFSSADQTFVRLDVAWEPTDSIAIRNTVYGYDAVRHWKNAEGAAYCDASLAATFPCTGAAHQNQAQRYLGYFILDHDQEQYGDRLTLNYARDFGERETRWVIGAEFNDIDFVRTRGFRINVPPADGDSVDIFNPVPGLYGPVEWRAASPTALRNRVAFGEGMVELLPSLKLVVAARHEALDLERKDINLRAGANFMAIEDQWQRTFRFWSYRAGFVYEIADNVMLYGQSSNAKDPVGRNIFIVQSSQNFDLTDANSWELGLKTVLMGGTAEATLAYYDIERDDISERYGRDDLMLIGARTARGVELSTVLKPTNRFNLGFAAAYTDAEILPSPNAVLLASKRPANIPEWTFSGNASYRMTRLPLDFGAAIRHVGDRFADHANTTSLLDYTIVNAFAGWSLGDNLRISASIDNAFDEAYVPWSDPAYLQAAVPGTFAFSNQIVIGSPRTYGLTVEARF